MKIMVAELENRRMVDVEDIGLTYCYCFTELNDGRIVGIGNMDDHDAICIWREVNGEYRHYVTVSLRNSGHDDCMMTITAATRMHMKMGQPPVCNDMELIIIG